MAHRKECDKARKLYEKGLYPPDIAAQLNIPLRTAQRWLKAFREENGAKIEGETSTDELLEQSLNLVRDVAEKQNLPNLEFQNQDWVESASNLADELLATHGKLRRKLVELLIVKLDDSDLNLRLIQGLSQSICRHSEREECICSLPLLDVNKAFVLVEKSGLLIINPALD